MQIVKRIYSRNIRNSETYLLKNYDFLTGTEKMYILKTVDDKYIKSTVDDEIKVASDKIVGYNEELKTGKYTSPEHGLIYLGNKLKSELAHLNMLVLDSRNVVYSMNLEKEIMFGKKAGELGVAPKIISWDPNYTSYVMEYLDGINMYTENYKMCLLNGFEDAFQNAVALLHSNGIYNLELNCSSIFVCADYRVYITNFTHPTDDKSFKKHDLGHVDRILTGEMHSDSDYYDSD